MPTSTACPTVPEILQVLHSESTLDQVVDLARHLVTCPACTDILIRLNITDNVIDRLRAVQAAGDPVDGDKIDGLILALRAATRGARSTPPTDHTVDSSPAATAVGEEDWHSLLSPPLFPDEIGRLGSYRVLRLLGRGGMGAVFEAEDPDLNRRVALKVPFRTQMKHRDARERFVREARIAAAVKDEHIVTIYQVGEVNELPFLEMELLTGESLEARLKRDNRLTLAEVVRFGREMAEGVAVAHDQGLIHRDIKPANIWLATRPSARDTQRVRFDRVKILDFGLARPEATDTHLTATGQILGTPHYMAPEQARGDPVDQRADLFSLGCVLYEMVSGAKAFSGNSVMAVLTALATVTPPPLAEARPELPPALNELIQRLLSKDPAERPATAWEVVEALRALEQALPALTDSAAFRSHIAVPAVSASATSRPLGRRRWGLLLAAALVVLGAIGLVSWLKPWQRPGPKPDGGATVPSLPSGPPIRVGVLHSRTGTMAMSERPVIDATLLAIEEVNENGGLLGSPVEAVVEDGQSDGAVFARKSEKLITQDRVAVVFGCWTSASRKAVRPVYEKHDHLLIYPVQYEGLEQSPNIFYLGAAPNQQIIPAVTWCCTFLKKKRLFLVGSDYVFPRAANAIIRDQAVALGAEIVGEEYLLLGSTDVQTVIQKIAASKAEVILNTINGDTNLAFFRALRAAGVTPAKIPTVSFSISEEELSSFSPKDVAGDYAAWNYFQAIDGPQNRAFVSRFQKQFGSTRVISDPMEAAYVGVHLWAQAVAEAKSVEPKAVRQALKTRTYDAPEGAVRIDAETQHTAKFVRIGQITPEGRFAIVYCSEQAIPPVPYPRTRPKADWDALLNDLHLRWGGQWANPGQE
jgi:urea transport system substrate-binding protein